MYNKCVILLSKWVTLNAASYITTNSRDKMFYSDGQDTRGIVSILYNY